MEAFLHGFSSSWQTTGLAHLTPGNFIMLAIGFVLLYLAIVKQFEPLLLLGIGFGCVLANLPGSGLMDEGGLLRYFFYGVEHEIFPPLIFLGIGALTDFGPLLANPITFLLGAAAQLGVFMAILLARASGFSLAESAAIGIIGGADGPTAIFVAMRTAPRLLGAIVVAAYSYMSLVPLILPPVMKFLTTPEERAVQMEQLRPVSKTERLLFPVVLAVAVILLLPPVAPLLGMLAFGNLLRESGVTKRLADSAQNELINLVTIVLSITVGATMSAENFLQIDTIKIILLGLLAFAGGAAGGVLLGKLFYRLSGGKINPLIGAAGVSAVPMSARVVQVEGIKYNPRNYLLMHAMGPNVAGVIGTAIAAGALLALLG